jgi:hypothetical protein
MIKGGPKNDWDYEIPHLLHNEAADILGGPHSSTKQRWKSLKEHSSTSPDADWMRMDSTLDPVIEGPDEANLLEIAGRVEEGIKLTSEERLILHKGFLMHDGLHFSFNEFRLCMNGRAMPCRVPTVSILRLLANAELRRGWDLSRLMSVLGCMHTNQHDAHEPDPEEQRNLNHAQMRRRRRMQLRRNHPSRHSAHSTLRWVGWMAEEHLPPPAHHILHPLAAWARDIQQRLNRGNDFDGGVAEAFLNHPEGLSELSSYPWLDRWKNYKGTRHSQAPVKQAIQSIGGKLKLRVRTKAGASRKTNIPDDPSLWAVLLSYALSPLTSHAGEMLFALQHNWSSRTPSVRPVAAPLKRSIEFLTSIIQGNPSRVFIHGKHILVVGRLNHFYEVTVETGAHGAPFRIQIIDSLQPRRITPVCIHNGSFHSTVPLGDTVASVVLSLLDDVTSSRNLNSLLSDMARHPPLGFPLPLDTAHIQMLNNSALTAFKKNVGSRSYAVPNIDWLPTREGGQRNEEFNMRFMHMRQALHNYVPSDGHIGGATHLVSHAAAADRPAPITALVNMWVASLKGRDRSAPRDETGHIVDHYVEQRHRHDWMFLRNHGQAEIDAPIGDIRNGERRFCEVFPRIWEALLLQPIGAEVRFGVRDGGGISFEHCQLNVTIRNAYERRLILRFATLAGYEERTRESGKQVFLRRDHPRQWARRNLSESLNRAQQRFGYRGAPPWWWHYREAQQAPRDAPEFRWELGVDLSDNLRPRMEGDFQP